MTRPPFFPREFLHEGASLRSPTREALPLSLSLFFLSLLSRIGTDEIEWKGRRNRFEPCGEFILIRSYSASLTDSSVADSKKLISLLAISILVAAFVSILSFYPSDLQLGGEKSFREIVLGTGVSVVGSIIHVCFFIKTRTMPRSAVVNPFVSMKRISFPGN